MTTAIVIITIIIIIGTAATAVAAWLTPPDDVDAHYDTVVRPMIADSEVAR